MNYTAIAIFFKVGAIKSYQNAQLLKNLYRLKAIGFNYVDHAPIDLWQDENLPNTISQLNQVITSCHLCDLSKSRTQSMSGYGNSNADVMFIDSTISQLQDGSNSYYVGKSGESLIKMIENVLQLSLEDVYITHAVKCKPLDTKEISQKQYESCQAYLTKQIELINPKVIVALGEDAYYAINKESQDFHTVRGHIIEYQKYKIVPTYHPNFLLRNPSLKKETLYDLKTIKSLL